MIKNREIHTKITVSTEDFGEKSFKIEGKNVVKNVAKIISKSVAKKISKTLSKSFNTNVNTNVSTKINSNNPVEPPVVKYRKSCGIFPISNLSDQELKKLALIVDNLIEKHNYQFFIYRFDSSNSVEDDTESIKKLKEYISNIDHFHLDLNIYNVYQMLENIKNLDAAICYRFHSHIFCTMCGIPFISLSSTRKVELYLEENEIDHVHDPENILEILESKELGKKLENIAEKNYNLWDSCQITNLLEFKSKRYGLEKKSLDQIHDEISDLVKNRYNLQIKNGIVQTDSHEIAEVISQIISTKVTNLPDSKYVYGTTENIKAGKTSIKEMIKWIMKDVIETVEDITGIDYNKGEYNINYIRQLSDQNVHRSGWNYVVQELIKYNSANGIILDAYLDKTFHWCHDAFLLQGIIPYTNRWCGFLHHTPLKEYTEYNTETLFAKKTFIQSLETCQGLFVLSDYLGTWVQKKLIELNYNIPVHVIYHPTEFPKKKFTFEKFNNTVIQIGAWMRDPLAIYLLKTKMEKKALKGLMMSNHFPPKDIFFSLSQPSKNEEKSIRINNISRDVKVDNFFIRSLREYILDNNFLMEQINDDSIKPPSDLWITEDWRGITKNEYTKSLSKFLRKILRTVEIVECLNNDEYDDLLSESVVFVKLLDASAVNTLIECVVRNTPIVINKIPAVVEILGNDYPLYYETIEEAGQKLTTNNIYQAHLYLKEMNKEFLKIDCFLMSLKNILSKN